MRQLPPTLACLVCLCAATFAQSPATPSEASPSFVAADVHPSPKRLHPEVQGGAVHGDRYYVRAATIVDLISLNYQVDPSSIFGGPQWLAFDRFDILAKVPPSTSDEAAREMVRALLADRFKLVAQPGTRPLPAFVLSAGKMIARLVSL